MQERSLAAKIKSQESKARCEKRKGLPAKRPLTPSPAHPLATSHPSLDPQRQEVVEGQLGLREFEDFLVALVE